MPITTLTRDWRRFHDAEGDFIAPNSTVHCVSDASSIIELCRDRPASKKYKSSGSHWALSTATVSDGEFIETNWPGNDNVPRHSGLDIDLFELIDDGMFDFMVTHPSQVAAAAKGLRCFVRRQRSARERGARLRSLIFGPVPESLRTLIMKTRAREYHIRKPLTSDTTVTEERKGLTIPGNAP
jgi:hypothetical protein